MPDPPVSKSGESTRTQRSADEAKLSSGSIAASVAASFRFRFQRPSSLQRKPMLPLGTTNRPERPSQSTVFHSALGEAWPRSAARRNRPALKSAPCSSSTTAKGRSV